MIYTNACPRCYGAVEYRADELGCLACGWVCYSGKPQPIVRVPIDWSPRAARARKWKAKWLAKFGLTHRQISHKLGVHEKTITKYLKLTQGDWID